MTTEELEAEISPAAGILVLIKPKLLNYIVATYLVAPGDLGCMR